MIGVVMAMSPASWFCLFTLVSGVGASDRQRGVPSRTSAEPETWWTPYQLQGQDHATPPVEPLAQDRHQVHGAEEEEQQLTFAQSYNTEWLTTPEPTESIVTVTTSAGSNDRDNEIKHQDQNSSVPELDGPFDPLAEGSYVSYVILLLASVLLAMGVVGNMAVMCIVWNNYYMRSAWNYLLASMAFWDFLVLVFCLPMVVLNQFSHRRIFGDITCCVEPYMEVVSLGITSFTLCALGIDRFHAATSSSQPKARSVERCRIVLLKLLLVWLAALLLSSPEIFLWQLSRTTSPSSGRLEDSCTITPSSPLSVYLPDSLHSLLLRYHQGRIWWCFGCYFCLPVVFTILSQMATRNVNSDANSPKKLRSHDDHSSSHKRQQAVERQLNSTLLVLAVVYAACALPEHATNITLAYTDIAISRDTAAMLALLHHFLLFLKSSVTPVLLLCLCKALRQTFVDCCCCCCQECQSTRTVHSADSVHNVPQAANETTVTFDKVKDTSAVSS